jgi:GNAT superfamily N-acetyltransferase
MYQETTANRSGAWAVLKDREQKTQGLMVLMKDGERNRIEIEAFIVAEELRTKPEKGHAEGDLRKPRDRPSHQLMREGLRLAQEKLGLNAQTDLFLYVTHENVGAQKFYHKFGFQPIKYLLDLRSPQAVQ